MHNSRVHFRRFVREVVSEWFTIVRGDLPKDAQLYKTRLLKIICSTGTKVLERFMRLTHLPQCDWRVYGQLKVYIPNGIDICEAKFKEQVIDAIEFALCGCAVPEYNKSKWNGHEAALDQVILHLAMGGVGEEAYRRLGMWLKARLKKSSPALAAELGVLGLGCAWGCSLFCFTVSERISPLRVFSQGLIKQIRRALDPQNIKTYMNKSSMSCNMFHCLFLNGFEVSGALEVVRMHANAML